MVNIFYRHANPTVTTINTMSGVLRNQLHDDPSSIESLDCGTRKSNLMLSVLNPMKGADPMEVVAGQRIK